MTYTGRLEDDDTELVCAVSQGTRGGQGTLYTSQIETRMAVTAADNIGPAIPIGKYCISRYNFQCWLVTTNTTLQNVL